MTVKEGVTESDGGGPLRNVVVSKVQPSSTSEHPEFLYPSIYDMLNIDTYLPSVCLYRLDPADPSAFSSFIHGVKDSLSQVLSLFYPMAGKWIVSEDAWIRKLLCNDEGAVFVEGTMDEEMNDIFDRNDLDIPAELTGEHAVPGFDSAARHKTSDANEYPSLIIQAIKFKCGGVALTLNFNHMTVDGYGFDRFLKAWSEIATTGHTASKPLFDRSGVVSHLEKGELVGITPDSRNIDDRLAGHFKSYNASQNNSTKLTRKLFGIRKDVVGSLRQKAKEEKGCDVPAPPERFTTFDCVTGQLLRSFARIPRILSGMSSDKKVRVFFPVEGRRKWNTTTLPEDFVGNVSLVAGSPNLLGAEITDRPLSFIASHLHEAVGSVNHQTSERMLDDLLKMNKQMKSRKEEPKTEESKNNSFFANTMGIFLTAGSRFHNFYSLDFGYGGPFLFFPCGSWQSPVAAAVFLLPPVPNSENVLEMCILSSRENFELLSEDAEFRNLVSQGLPKIETTA